MAHSFIAYIDESGDDGLAGRYRQPGVRGGSSHWLALGATVWRLSRDLDAVRWANSIIDQMPEQKRTKPLHFKDMNHQQRVMAISALCGRPFRSVTVLASKQPIPAGTYRQPNHFYHYLCRYLLERISWLCRDARKDVPEGDGRVQIVFSRKRSMDYNDFRSYIQRLRDMNDPTIQIHWPVIDIDGIDAQDHGAGLGFKLQTSSRLESPPRLSQIFTVILKAALREC